MIPVVILFSVVFNSAQGQSASVQNIGPRYVNGFPDQIALEQGQQQFIVSPNAQQQFVVAPNAQQQFVAAPNAQQQFVVAPNAQQQFVATPHSQQNYIIDGNILQAHQHVQTVQVNPGQTTSSLVYPENQQPGLSGLIYQPHLQNLPQQQVVQFQTPEGNQFVNLQYPSGTQIAQNSHPAPVYQQQPLQYFSVAPQTQQLAPKVHFSHPPLGAPFSHYGALHFPVENPQILGIGHPVALPPPELHFKPTVFQPVPVPVHSVVKEIIKVPVPVKFNPICTVYPFQKNIPGCVLEKALFPGKYHPDVVPSSSQTSETENVKTTATPTTVSTVAKPEAKTGPGKKESPRKKTPGKDSFVVLNNAEDEDISNSSTEGSLNFDDEDEKLFQELEKEMQNKKDQ